MEAALRPLIGTTPLDIIDVDDPQHARLEEQYGDLVPVLFAGLPEPANEICRYRLDVTRLPRDIASPAR
jgi:hypothetical protein